MKIIKLILMVVVCLGDKHIFSQDWGEKFRNVRDGALPATPIRSAVVDRKPAPEMPSVPLVHGSVPVTPIRAFALDSSVSKVSIGLKNDKKSSESVAAAPTSGFDVVSSPVRARRPKIDSAVVFTAEEEIAATEAEAQYDLEYDRWDQELISENQHAIFISEYAMGAVDLWQNDCKAEAKKAVALFANSYPDDILSLRFFLKRYQAKTPSIVE